MDSDNRQHPRFSPAGLTANITIKLPPPDEEITMKGTIIDMSYTGIKIKLDTPIVNTVSANTIQINLTTPESGIPITIHGIIKHFNDQSEYGMEYSATHPEQKFDDLMFECIRIAR